MAIHLSEVEAKKKLEEAKHNVMPMKLPTIPEEERRTKRIGRPSG